LATFGCFGDAKAGFSGATEDGRKEAKNVPSGRPAYDWLFLDEWTIEEA
jgi:hypothetical protein